MSYLDKETFLQEARATIKSADIALISRAWDKAREKHAAVEQRRETGEEYFSHPVGVAKLLLQVECDDETIAAALLHDVVEDTDTTIDEIRSDFGQTVASLVDGVTKLSKLDTPPGEKWTKNKRRLENLRKLFIYFVNDPRVAIIKIADRVHNLESLGPLDEHRRKRIAEESLAIYAPLAEALGLGYFQERIQDCAFRYTEPDVYAKLRQQIMEKRPELQETRNAYVALLEEELQKSDVGFLYIYSREKSLYSIYRKMQELNLDFESVYDVIGIRIIVEKEQDCYAAKYIVDQLGPEVKYDDHIVKPRGPLGYQSLHKVVSDIPAGNLIEVQIRTQEMHDRAERGKAAHWIYKMGSSLPSQAFIDRISSIRNALESISDDLVDIEDLINLLNVEGLFEQISVFTPEKDRIILPVNSTPIDFAYHIHTELGHECIGAKVNGKIVSLDRKLNHGDTVEIIRKKGGKPNLDWLQEDLVVSSNAKSKIRHYFRNQERPRLIELGDKIVRQKLKGLKNLGISQEDLLSEFGEVPTIKGDAESLFIAVAENRIDNVRLNRALGKAYVTREMRNLDIQANRFQNFLYYLSNQNLITKTNEDQLYGGIVERRISINDFKKALLTFAATQSDETLNIVPGKIADEEKILSDSASTRYLFNLARCCCPVPGDEITGYTTVGKGLSIHRKICPNVLDPIRQSRTTNDIHWHEISTEGKVFPAEIFVVFDELNAEIYSNIQDCIKKNQGKLQEFVEIGKSMKRYYSQVRILVGVTDIRHLNKIIKSLKTVEDVLRVRRKLE